MLGEYINNDLEKFLKIPERGYLNILTLKDPQSFSLSLF